MTHYFVLVVVGLLTVASGAFAGSEQAMARCTVEYMKHEEALRSQRENYFKTGMKGEGFDFGRYPLTCLGPQMANCYLESSGVAEPEPKSPLKK